MQKHFLNFVNDLRVRDQKFGSPNQLLLPQLLGAAKVLLNDRQDRNDHLVRLPQNRLNLTAADSPTTTAIFLVDLLLCLQFFVLPPQKLILRLQSKYNSNQLLHVEASQLLVGELPSVHTPVALLSRQILRHPMFQQVALVVT
jgi:hypothetical protein